MKAAKVLFLYEGRTNSVFRDPLLGIPAALRNLGIRCVALDIRHVSDEQLCEQVRRHDVDLVFQVTRRPESAWRIARLKPMVHRPLALWNLEEPNAVAAHNLTELAKHFDLYATIDKRMCRFHSVPVMHLPLFFDEGVYYDRLLQRDLSAAFLIQISTPRLRQYVLPLVRELEACPDSFVTVNRPTASANQMGRRIAAKIVDRAPLALANLVGQAAQRCGVWKQDHCIRAHGFFINRDEEEKAFIYGRAKIGIGFSRVFGPWDRSLSKVLPDYERDPFGNCVQLKSRQFEIAGAGAMLLSDSSPDLDELFTPGIEYVPYDYTQPSDFREKLTFLIKNDRFRDSIAAAGYKRAQQEHTLARRISSLVSEWNRRW